MSLVEVSDLKGTPMPLPPVLAGPLTVPVVASPMFIYSGP